MTELFASHVRVRLGKAEVVHGADLSVKPGRLSVLLGPNGAGKTTLLRACLGIQPLFGGWSELDGRAINTMSPRERARLVAYLPQTRPLAWPAPVEDIVALGRFAYGTTVGRLSHGDQEAVERALASCSLSALRERPATRLSGGETARMHCARAFAAEAPLLVADEPVTGLDPRYRFEIMDLIRRFVDQGGGALIVLHDVVLAARYGDHLIWMQNGWTVAEGSPQETLTQDRLAESYGVEAAVRRDGDHMSVELLGLTGDMR